MRKVLLASVVAMLSLASTGFGTVIGDFEYGMAGWDNTWEAKSTLSIGTIGATSGSKSLVVTPVKNGFSWALRYNCPTPIDFNEVKRISVDVTWVASEWTGSGMWIQFQLMAINSNGASGWKQSNCADPFNSAYPGSWDPVNWGDQTRTLTWDVSGYDGTGATWMQLVFSTNMGGVETAGNYYIDNVRLLGAAPKVAFVSFHGTEAPTAGAAGVGFTAAPDKGYTDLLKANGFDVARFVQSGTPDVNALNACDLVIISRSVGSTSFQNAAATTWNTAITAPLMSMSGYILRKNRMGFSTGNTIPDTTGAIKLQAVDAGSPIWAGIAMTDGVMDANYADICTYPDGVSKALGISVNTDAVPATGHIIGAITADATTGPANAMIIGEWPAGATVTHDGGAGTDILGGRRMTFLTGSREASGKNSEGTGMIDLTPDGSKLFINAVNYMVAKNLAASEPRPADGSTGIPLDAKLTWDSGKLAEKNQVYISAKKDDVVSGKALVDVVTTNSYSLKPMGLLMGTTYYWKIVGVSGNQTWESAVWSFKTIDYVVIDDFESYDASGIAKAWVDGWKMFGTLLTSHAAPVVCTAPAHEGKQSMALAYSCGINPFLTEVKRAFSPNQNWSRANAGATTLVIFFHGDPNNSVQPIYAMINGCKVSYSGDINNIRKAAWTTWTISIDSLPTMDWKVIEMNIGVGNVTAHPAPNGTPVGGKGTLYIDDIRLYRVAP